MAAFHSLYGRLFGVNPSTGDLTDGDSKLIARAPANRVVTLAVSTTITAVDYDGKTILMDGEGSARTFTLPASSGSGAKFRFMVRDVNTSNYVIKVANTTDIIQGTIHQLGDDAAALGGFTSAGTSDTITLNGTTTGGAAKGDWVEIIDAYSGVFLVTGLTTASGTEATPFSATV